MRISRSWAVVCAAAVVLTACGNDDTGETAVTSEEPGTSEDGESAASDESFEIRFATAVPDNTDNAAVIQTWSAMVEEVTEGRVTVNVFYGASLVGATEEIAAIEDGRVDGAYVPALYAPDRWPLFNHPPSFTVSNPVDGLFAWHKTLDEVDELADELRNDDVYAVGFLPIPELALGTPEEIESYRDLEGLQIRSVGEGMDEAMRIAGADPSYVVPAEAYESVQRGVLDAWTGMPMAQAVTQGMHELTPHFNGVGLGPGSTAVFLLSTELWESFGEELQSAIDEGTREWYYEVGDAIAEVESSACEQLRDEGGEAYVLPESDIEEWREQALPLIEEIWVAQASEVYDSSVIDAFLDTFKGNIDEAEGESGYVNGLEACAGQ